MRLAGYCFLRFRAQGYSWIREKFSAGSAGKADIRVSICLAVCRVRAFRREPPAIHL